MCGMRRTLQVKIKKRWTALCLAVVTAVSLMGCGGPAGSSETTENGVRPGNAGGGVNEAVAMGRYVEAVSEVDAGSVMDIRELTDGRLVLLEDGAAGRMVSADGGVTWSEDVLPGWYELLEAGYSMVDMKAAPDGSVALLCRNYKHSLPQEDGQAGEETDETENPSGEEPDEAAEGEALTVMEMPESYIGVYLISPDGKTQWARIALEEEEKLDSLCFSEDGGRLLAASDEGKIYEIDRNTGEGRFLMTVDIAPDMFCVWENYMAVKSEQEGVRLYDMETTERIADDVLSDFVSQNCKGNQDTFLSTYTIFPAEKGSLYLACNKGMYRHVIGGAAMEQVINGGLSSFSDPARHVSKVIRFGENGFLAAFSEGKISNFTYDANISTTPSQRMTAYSLTESTILRQAIIRYQGEHSDVYVEYKVGMDEEGGVTREDAVKKLNAEIMAGKGPDFLLLDGLPAKSYIQKGVLADISPYLAELEKEEKLLPNIKESFSRGDGICMIPAAIILPMYFTDKENMTGVSDLPSLADMIERQRSLHPGEEILEIYSEEMILNTLMPVSAPLWFTDSGKLDTEELSVYLEQAKRIYEVCMEGLPEETLEKYRMRAEEESFITSSDEVSAYNDLQGGGLQIAAGELQVSAGPLINAYNYAFLQSITRIPQGENCQASLLPGSVKDSFIPVALMGVSAVSDNADLAGSFLQEILSKDMQSRVYPVGFPINEAGLSAYLKSLGGMVPEERMTSGEAFGGYGLSTEDGEIIVLKMYVPDEQERQALYNMLMSVRTPYLSDVMLEDAVREAGKHYLNDRCSLQEAVEMIQKKTEIYMAE